MLSLLFNSAPIRRPLSVPCLRSLHQLATSGSLRSGRFSSPALGSPPALRSQLRSSMAVPQPASLSNLAALDSEVGLAKKLWIKCRRESVFAMYNPFAVCLASGNLKLDTFRHYIAQDVYFLKAFAQAYERAEECADDDDEKAVISELRRDVLEELKMHDSFVEEWGTNTTESTPNPATVRYTDFLLATASGKVEGLKAPGKLATPFEKTKVAAYTLGAMTPCMRLYAFLGKEFQTFLDLNEESHPYKKWIDTYSSESFQASAVQTEDLLDKLSVSLTGEELEIIEKLYHQAMKLEIEFFNAQPLAQLTTVPLIKEPHHFAEDRLMLFSDFDLTCTVLDSSAILAEIAIVTAPKSDQPSPEGQIARMSSADLRRTWEILSKQYTAEYEECMESIMASEKVEQFNYEVLAKALQQLAEFEKRANDRVIESEVLKGLNLEDIKRAGERLILQDGCTAFFQKLVKSENVDVNVHVLSYCWCGDLIRSALLSGDLSVLNIHANELTFNDSISTGEIVKNMESPIDKVQAFRDILKDQEDKKNVTVYVGDSVGDLLCLLEADIGIVIGNSSSLRRIGNHFGVSFVPLFSGLVKKQEECHEGSPSQWNSRSGILYSVSSWAEIHAFILGW